MNQKVVVINSRDGGVEGLIAGEEEERNKWKKEGIQIGFL